MKLKQLVSPETLSQIDHWITKYPTTQKQSAVLPVMMLVQDEHHGWLTNELIEAVADYLGMSHIAAYEVVSFYTMFESQPIGKHKISVCTNISCQLNGAEKIVDHLEKRCGTKLGETSADGKFTLREVECMGACIRAPMLEYNKQYYESLTPEKVDELLETMK
ncbi:MAG: nuoE [Gammaproteobacteria bacterium]|jgi:NADH-quinone oxidoreductase subunit E|nr:nuoE [Gammaproteobacteria bacterium]